MSGEMSEDIGGSMSDAKMLLTALAISYGSSKAALMFASQILSEELKNYNIRVNAFAPSITETDMMEKNTPENVLKEVISNSSLNRIGETKDIANTALFLASDLSNFITGQTIRVDGGM